jgi:hypothetical protein
MTAYLIVSSGILSFILFTGAVVTGIRRLRLLRYHRMTGISCCVTAILHSVLAFSVHMIDPLGLLAGLFMIGTSISGYRTKTRLRMHLVLTGCTFLFIIMHVILMLIVG